MNVNNFVDFCKEEVVNQTNEHIIKTDYKITKDNVFMVWCCKALLNNKAILGTNLLDGMYYEITYNGDKDEAYIDVYKKQEHYKVENVKEH